ncbi:unnamed protein product [Diamesa hyperborea]
MRFVVCAIYLIIIMPLTTGWAEGSNILLDPTQVCKKSRKIPNKILDICKQESRNKTSLLKKITRGISMGFRECETQFRNRRWNCSTQRKSMKKILLRDTRETAFVNAITSAGIAYAVAKACSMGELVECSCDKNLARHNVLLNNNPKLNQMTTIDNNTSNRKKKNSNRQRNNNNNNNIRNNNSKNNNSNNNNNNNSNKQSQHSKQQHKSKPNLKVPTDGEDWEWGGCDDNVNFGNRKSKDFLDSRLRRRSDIKTLVRIHNNNAGRLAVKKSMRLDCKCHGLSGSCTMKTCWMKLPSFSEVAHRLKDRFDGASKVIARNDGSSFMTENLTIKPPTKQDLVYTDESLDFCKANPKTGSLGVQGRECNITSNGVDGCGLLCCNNGYQRQTVFVKSNCKCRFIWCCEVVCSTCMEKKEIYTCR